MDPDRVTEKWPIDTQRFVLACHAGCTERAPENTLQAALDAVRLGADLLECDIRTTADGHLILMHDERVDRTTDGEGAVAQHTLAQIRRLTIQDTRLPRLRKMQVPTLEALLQVIQSKVGLYVDTKDVAPSHLRQILTHGELIAKSYAYVSLDELPLWQRDFPSLRRMVTVPQNVTTATEMRSFLQKISIHAIDGPLDLPEPCVLEASRHGVAFIPDTLTLTEGPSLWNDVIHRGAVGIQTDQPTKLTAFLTSRNLR